MVFSFTFLLLIYIYLFLRNRLLALSLLPAMLLIMDAGFTFFESNSIITYYKALITVGIVIIYFSGILKNIKKNKPIALFIFYCIVLIVFSSEMSISIRNSLKVLPPMLFYFIGLFSFNSEKSIQLLFKSMLSLIIISVIFGSIGYLFGIGQTFDYGDADLGAVGLLQGGNYYPVSISITIVLIVLIDRSIIFKLPIKALLIILSSITYIFILLTMRRTSIILPIIGIVSIIISNPKSISRLSVTIGIIFSIMAFTSTLYIDTLSKRYLIRAETGRFDTDFYQNENRVFETQRIFEDILSFDDPVHSLIGKNVFAGGWVGGVAHRMHHTDHGQILDTSGLIGFIIYTGMFVFFFRKYLQYKKKYNFSVKIKSLNSLLLATVLILIVTGLNGSIFIVTFRVTTFLILGAIIGRIEALKKTYRNSSMLNRIN